MSRKNKAIITGFISVMFFTATAISASGNEVPKQEFTTTTTKTETVKAVLNSSNSLEVPTPPATTTASTTISTTTSTTTTTTQTTETTETSSTTVTSTTVMTDYYWDGPVLNSFAGKISGPSGNETYYNLDMSGVIREMQRLGYDYEYKIRDDGVKTYGGYVMCAANLSIRPKGTIVDTSLGKGIVCDTGGFVKWDSTRLDIATNW